jgi:hypothetical protein
MDQQPSINRVVRYVTPTGKIRPAMVVEVNKPSTLECPPPGSPPVQRTVNLQVFTDGTNDHEWIGTGTIPSLVWVKAVPYCAQGTTDGESHVPETWHWPPRG